MSRYQFKSALDFSLDDEMVVISKYLKGHKIEATDSQLLDFDNCLDVRDSGKHSGAPLGVLLKLCKNDFIRNGNKSPYAIHLGRD